MSEPAPLPALARAPSRAKPWSTPARLRSGLFAVWLTTGLALIAAQSALARVRDSAHAILVDSAPSILAAQTTGAHLAELDAEMADLMNGAEAQLDLPVQRAALAANIVRAAETNAFGESERRPIIKLVDQLGVYLDLTGQIRFARQAGDSARALTLYSQATEVMHDKLLPAADQVDDAASLYLEHALGDVHLDDEWLLRGLTLVWSLEALALLGVQLYLLVHARRLLNPGLAIATALALGTISATGAALEDASGLIRSAKRDGFDSMRRMVRAQTLAYDAYGDASRALLDPGSREAYQRGFDQAIRQLADPVLLVRHLPAPGSVESVGLLYDEARAAAGDPEREAAGAALRELATLASTEASVRSLEAGGQHQAAVDLCMGGAQGQLRWALQRFIGSLRRIDELDERYFTGAMSRVSRRLDAVTYLPSGSAILVCLLTWLGLRPRLREYRL